MTFNPFGATTYVLASSIGSTDTTITLSSFLEPVTNTPYTMVLLNTDIVYATIAPKTNSSEFISFTGIVQNADGTATLTGVVRGLAKKSPFTTSSAYKLPHSGQTQFIISNPPQLYNEYVTLDNDESIIGEKTFPAGGTANAPKSGTVYAAPVDDLEYASKKFVTDTASGGTTNINRVIIAGVAGETILVDQLIYLKVSDGRWWKCDADTAATVENVVLGISQGGGTAGVSITGGVLIYGLNTFSALTLTANTKYYASNTAGGFSSSAGTFNVTVGETGDSTGAIFFNPRFDQQLTQGQKEAAAGNNGTPSTTNKFMTQSGFQLGAEIYAATATGNDTYVLTLSPAISAYSNGMLILIKVDVGNTGPATVNINGVGAVSIVTGISTALVTGDMLANGVYVLAYNSTGTVFQLLNPSSATLGFAFTNGTTTKNAADASTTQNIAHGLGRIPKKIRIRAIGNAAGSSAGDMITYLSETVYNGATQSSVSLYGVNNAIPGTIATTFSLNTGAVSSVDQTGVVTFDATNIIITWTKTGAATGTYTLLWEAEG